MASTMSSELKRIAEQDDELARLIVGSKNVDAPGSDLHARILAAMQGAASSEERAVASIAAEPSARRASKWFWAAGAAGVAALAAALALRVTSHSSPDPSSRARPSITSAAPPSTAMDLRVRGVSYPG
jgi:hypothetical protein